MIIILRLKNEPVMISQISSPQDFRFFGIYQSVQKMIKNQGIIPVVFVFIFFSSCKKGEPIINTPPPQAITIKSIKPLTANPGDTIIIVGTNFSLTPSKDTVKFNGIVAEVIKASADTLYVIVPPGNASGYVSMNGILDSTSLFSVFPNIITITSVKPGWGKQGDTIQIIGTHFNTNPVKDTVTINGVTAVVEKASADTLYVIVPLTSTGAVFVNGVSSPAPGFIYGPTVFVTTFAGTGSSSTQYDFGDGPDSLAKISPLKLCFDKQGNLFVLDGAYCIREISAGSVSTFAGDHVPGNVNGPNLQAEFSGPGGMAIDSQGNLYVTNNNTIRIISNGNVSFFAGGMDSGSVDGPAAQASFFNPGNLAVDPQNNVYVAEPGAIRKISPSGMVSTFAGKGTTRVDNPGPIIPVQFVTHLGYVNGQDTAARFGNIGGLTTDAQGNVYAGDLQCQCVRKITPSGLVSTLGIVGFYNYRDSYNSLPGICTDAAGNIYITAKGAIMKITPLGAVSVLAGNETFYPADSNNFGFGYADGPAELALFNFPTGLAFDAQGNLFVADEYNFRIRKITMH